ncbi:MAG: GTPase/DUF3482 domain-containing protein [Gammaproteobacteria bacterium]|nr:GTPase/DUF3482 domain-containing protein [Gammaproteobacteria bacterium]
MIPTFAVVGHPNKGKSSIVATLAEDDGIAIGPTPGTTREAQQYVFRLDGEPHYVLVDTPGFQRVKAVFDWLQARATGAHQRSGLVEEFVRVHADDDRFRDECALLQPMIDGAGILYVVDGAKPYGPEYELEMQVLQWTGRPRMALINLIGEGDYVEQWRQALDQYFSIVRVFDAVHADFSKRIALLRGFGELDESWREPIDRAVAALEKERDRRRERAGAEIADCLVDTLNISERATLRPGDDAAGPEMRLTAALQDRIRKREARAREAVQGLYRHHGLQHEVATAQLLDADIFTEEGWELFGLSHTQLVISGVVSGAVAGGGIDALLGGATFLLGAGIGALIGGAGAWFGSDRLAKVEVLGQSLGGRVLRVGPVTSPNFPWVMLGRGWVHHRLVAERNHARREAISLEVAADQHLMDALPDDLRKRLGVLFKRIVGGDRDPATRRALCARVGELLGTDYL